MRRPLTVVALPAACVALAGCGLGGADGGGDVKAADADAPGGRGALSWTEAPLKTKPSPELLPDDVVVLGRVRNDSLKRLRLPAAQIKVLDERGRVVPDVAITFTTVGGHGLYPPRRVGTEYPRLESEEVRTGRIAKLKPGDEVPLVVGWRARTGRPDPAAIDYGSGRLDLP